MSTPRTAEPPGILQPHHGDLKLLVSVSNAADAAAALAGGADIIDAKDPLAGALGAVAPDVLRAIHAAVAGARPVTAAIGDAFDEESAARTAAAFAAAGASLVKIGFAGIDDPARVEALLRAAVGGARIGGAGAGPTADLSRAIDHRRGVIAVAYADASRAGSLEPGAFIDIAARAGAAGVLLDTADKGGPGLTGLIDQEALAAWIARAHAGRLLVALAGKLTLADFARVRDAGADVAGVRGAACDGGRSGRVSTAKIVALRAACGLGAPAPDATYGAPA
jgi:(5-formylfuran-3-yl)methyl phosphate synthase